MQFLWRYIDELVGKGLSFGIIAEFVGYATITLVPLSLPLAILLSSIMTYGNLGEHFELVAIKSSGISLFRSMISMIIFIIILSISIFFFSNYILPIANIKLFTLLFDIRQKSPALNIIPGQFYNELDGYSIYINEKSPDSRIIKDVIIYDHSSGRGNDQVITATEGEMFITPDTNYLVMRLKNGKRYEELPPKYNTPHKYEQIRTYFEYYEKVFNLSDMKIHRSEESLLKDHYKMMNINQLKYVMDTIKKYEIKMNEALAQKIYLNLPLMTDTSNLYKTIPDINTDTITSLEHLIPAEKYKYYRQQATIKAREIAGKISMIANDKHVSHIEYRKYKLEWHRKFTLSFACIVLFFIGAPFGAIIRKGGLGLPMIASVIFFLIYHILNTIGFKIADDEIIRPFWGMWLGTLILLPLGFYFTFKAINDSKLAGLDNFNIQNLLFWKKKK